MTRYIDSLDWQATAGACSRGEENVLAGDSLARTQRELVRDVHRAALGDVRLVPSCICGDIGSLETSAGRPQGSTGTEQD